MSYADQIRAENDWDDIAKVFTSVFGLDDPVLESASAGGGQWIGVDLDGTLAMDDGKGFDPKKIGEPIPAMLQKVKQLIRSGRRIKIFTARAANRANVPLIQEWLKKNGLGDLPVTNRKDRYMRKLLDDRAIPIKKNEGTIDRSVTVAKIFESAAKETIDRDIKAANSFEDIARIFSLLFGVGDRVLEHKAEDKENLKKLTAGEFNDLEPEPFLKVLMRIYRTTLDMNACRHAAVFYVAANLGRYIRKAN